MTKKSWEDLANGPVTAGDIDELEALARAHEDLAYRYRRAISLLRKRMQKETPAVNSTPLETREPGAKRSP